MPGWHAGTVDLQREKKLRVVGIVQEQHPDRARLFLQWQRIDWPVLVDSLNLIGLTVVPVMILVDEHGIVRHLGSPAEDPSEALARFLAADYPPPEKATVSPEAHDLAALAARAERAPSATAWRELGDALLLSRAASAPGRAIDAYRKAIELDPEDAVARFRSGVAHRMRLDSDAAQAGDFRDAVAAWEAALELDPNNYIWRRRIQQYGPRLAKPYPFYDWVGQARREIRQRGEVPVELPVEPRGAELARPLRAFPESVEAEPPDPEGRILRDRAKFVDIRSVVIPGKLRAGESARIHLELRPRDDARAHWNNEVRNTVAIWIDAPDGWEVDGRLVEAEPVTAHPDPVSGELRRAELEVRSPAETSGTFELSGYALYYVCEGRRGQCLYRRQDLRVPVTLVED